MQMKPHPSSDLQGKVTIIVLPVRWARICSGKLCCQVTALVLLTRTNIHVRVVLRSNIDSSARQQKSILSQTRISFWNE